MAKKVSEKPSLAEFIRSEIRRALSEALGDLTAGKGEGTDDARDADDDSAAAARDSVDSESSEGDQPRKRRRRRRRFSRVAYRIIPKKGMPPELQENPSEVYTYLKKHQPATAKDIEANTGMKKKAVESALHALRVLGLVKSEPLE